MLTRILCSASVLFLAVLIPARRAQAGGVVGVDANLSRPIGDGSDGLSTGWGLGVRAGLGLPLAIVRLELGGLYRYNHWSVQGTSAVPLVGSQTANDLLAGGRLSIGAFLQPWAAFYIGYGHESTDVGAPGGPQTSNSSSGAALLIGGGLDVSLGPIAVGAHLDYNKDVVDSPAGSQDAHQWLSLGANLTLSF